MSKFLADWRNIALVVTAIGTVLFGSLWISAHHTTAGTAIVVGDREFTETDIVKELKNRAGNQIVQKLVLSALIDNYARQKDVTASPAEVDQLWNFEKTRVELAGQDFNTVLKNQGLSEKDLRDDLRTQVLQIKLIVSPDEMKSTVDKLAKSGKPPFTLPTRYRIRIMTFANAESAQNAVRVLQKTGDAGVAEAAANAADSVQAKVIRLYAPGLTPASPTITNAIKGLSAGQCSKLLPIPGKGREDWRGVIQVVNVEPAVLPTYENSNILAGQVLLQTGGEKYAQKVNELEGQALNAVDVQFYTDEFEDARLFFKDRQLKNPVIPSVPNARPSAGVPSTPSATPKSGK
ncbi:MAG TPA: hypothetical protein VHV83_06820 [Armatimonadota bacterium]|nr:hypothetical protein [Armatimonadota bacterium]